MKSCFYKILTVLLIIIVAPVFSYAGINSQVGIYGWDAANPEESRKILVESNSALPVNIQDQHTEIVDLYLSRLIDTVALINSTILDDTTIYIETTGSTPVVGNIVCLKEGSAFYQAEVLTVTLIAGNQYTITLDSPLDYAFTTLGGCSVRSTNLAVDGSVTPIEFILSPANLSDGIEWDITRMIIHIQGSSAMDDGLFGDIPSLAKGIVFRVVNGITKNIFNAKNNGDFAEHAYDREYSSKAPAGKTSVTIRRSFSGFDKNGVTVRLKAVSRDKYVALVQDNLSALDHMHVVAQGHVVTN